MNNTKILYSQLQTLLEDESTYAATIEKHFDLNNENPFHPVFELKKGVEIIFPEDEAAKSLKTKLRDMASNIARRKRRKKYLRMKRKNPNGIRIVSEGDSWFQHPIVHDLIDHLMDYGYLVKSIGAAGDELVNMFLTEEFAESIQMEEPEFLLLSAGGNDILGEKMIHFLEDVIEIDDPGVDPQRFLKNNYAIEIKVLHERLKGILTRANEISPKMKIIIHGYDYAIPSDSEKKGWAGRYMIEKGIDHPKDKMALMKLMIDQYNEMLESLAKDHDYLTYINLRNSVANDKWHDEIHPNREGFLVCAEQFKVVIEQLKETPIVA